MLAQSFKTPAELGLDDAEHGALVRVLGMLEREEIPRRLFDMRDIGEPGCGTPGCIYGWAQTVGCKKIDFSNLIVNRGLLALFAPATATGAYQAVPGQAAIALRSYLTTGDSCWDEAMS